MGRTDPNAIVQFVMRYRDDPDLAYRASKLAHTFIWAEKKLQQNEANRENLMNVIRELVKLIGCCMSEDEKKEWINEIKQDLDKLPDEKLSEIKQLLLNAIAILYGKLEDMTSDRIKTTITNVEDLIGVSIGNIQRYIRTIIA